MEGNEKKQRIESMKKLRESRKDGIEAVSAGMKKLRGQIDLITDELRKGSGTVPELASKTGISTETVMWIVASLKKYGQVEEGEKDGSYFRYRLSS